MQWDIVFGIRIPIISNELSKSLKPETFHLKVDKLDLLFEIANWRIIDGDGNLLILECDVVDKNQQYTTTQFEYYAQHGTIQYRTQLSLASLCAKDYENCYRVLGIENKSLPILEKSLLEEQVGKYLKENSSKLSVIVHEVNHQLKDELKETWYTPKDSLLRVFASHVSFSRSYLSLHINIEVKERATTFYFPTEQATLENDFVYYISQHVVMKYFYLPHFNKLGKQSDECVHSTSHRSVFFSTTPWYHMSNSGEHNSTPLFIYDEKSASIQNQHTMFYENEQYFGFYDKTGDKLDGKPETSLTAISFGLIEASYYEVFEYMISDQGDYSFSLEKDQFKLTIKQKGRIDNHGLFGEVSYGTSLLELDQVIKIKCNLQPDGTLQFGIEKHGEPHCSYSVGPELIEEMTNYLFEAYNSMSMPTQIVIAIYSALDIKAFIGIYLYSIVLKIAQHEFSETQCLSPKYIDMFLDEIIKIPSGLKTKAARFEVNYGFVVSGSLAH